MPQQNKNDDLKEFEVEITNSEKKDYPLLPEFVYLPARLNAITRKKTTKGDRARFEFILLGKYKDEGRKAWGSVPLHSTVSENADLYTFLSMLLGRTVEIGEKIKFGNLIGKEYDIVVENQKVGDNTYQNVCKMRPKEQADSEPDIKEEEITSEPKATEEAVEKAVEEKPEEEISDDDLPF